MNITVKKIHPAVRVIYFFVVAGLLIAAILLYIFGQRVQNERVGFALALGAFGCIVLLVACIAITIWLFDRKIKLIDKTIKSYLEQRKFEDSIRFLINFTTKRQFNMVNQLILYYLGYLELCCDRLENSVYYLQQIKYKHYNSMLRYCVAQAIAFLYLTFYLTQDDRFAATQKVYRAIHEKLFTHISHNQSANVKKIIHLLQAVNCLEDGRTSAAEELLSKTPYWQIPVLQRLKSDAETARGAQQGA